MYQSYDSLWTKKSWQHSQVANSLAILDVMFFELVLSFSCF
jgi:hypothetical protein